MTKKDDDVMLAASLGGALLIDPSRATDAGATPEAPAPKPEAKLTDANEALREEMRTAFYDLCAYADKEAGKLRKVLKGIMEPEAAPADQIIKVARLLLARAERYKAKKEAFRKGGLIVRPEGGAS